MGLALCLVMWLAVCVFEIVIFEVELRLSKLKAGTCTTKRKAVRA